MYEASEIVAIGKAHDLILGVKPLSPTADSENSIGFDERQNDIDETE